jgi:hypothetical protein
MSQRLRLFPLLAVAAACAACGGLRERMDGVIVTALPKEIAACKSVGQVATYSSELSKDDGLDQLRERALDLGGNTVFVSSYSTSTSGVAYVCNPPLNPDGHPGHHPWPVKAPEATAPAPAP